MSADADLRARSHSSDPDASSAKTGGWPSKIGKYEIEKKLGAGGMGAVFLARDTQLRRMVAIKVLPRDKAENATLVRRFKAEAQAAAQLRHDNIVAVYDSGEADGYLYIAMEYVEGQDLHEMVSRRGPVPVKRSIEIIKQVASALQHAHEHKIVHRDIKPSNLLIRRDGVVKLTDLGLARSVDDTIETGITRAGTTVGTVDYMAPEQARSSQAADIRSDLYSLGCTWYHMVTGSPPYAEGSLTNKLQAHAIKPLPDPRTVNPKVTEGLVAVIHRMISKKPQDRYQSPAELLQDLEASTLTRAAFSQEILNAAEEDSAPPTPSRATDRQSLPLPSRVSGSRLDRPSDEDAPTSGGSSGESSSRARKSTTLPPPASSRRPVVAADERPPSQLAEKLKVVGLIAGILAVIGGLGWLASNVGGLFDAPSTIVRGPVPAQDPEALPEPGTATVAAVSGGPAGPMADTSTKVAPVFSSSANGPAEQGTATAAMNSSTGGSSATADGRPAPAISSAKLDAIRPAQIEQKPAVPKLSTADAPRGQAVATVGGGAASASHFGSLNDALQKMSAEGTVIKLVGPGPFPISRHQLVRARRLTILGDPQAKSLIVLGAGPDQQIGRLAVQGDLELSHVHLVLDRQSHPPASATSLIHVQDGSLTMSDSSLTVLGDSGAEVSAIAMASTSSPAQLLLHRTAIRGQLNTGLHLQTPAIDAAINESLLACYAGPAVRFQGPTGQTAPGVTSRWLRGYASTLCSPDRLIDFGPEANLESPAKTEIVWKNVVGCTGTADGSRVLLSVVNWLQPNVREQISWSATSSSFLGFQHLMDLGNGSSLRVDNAESWRLFWRQKVDDAEFLSDIWPAAAAELSRVKAANFSRNELPATARVPGSDGELRGVSAEWLSLPEELQPERLMAMASRPVAPESTGWGAVVTVDIRDQDLGDVLAKPEFPDGSVIEAVGYGVCQMSPVKLQGRRLKIVFRQASGGPLRVMSNQQVRGMDALFQVEGGILELEGIRCEVPRSGTRYPGWLVSAVNARVVLRNSLFRGVDAAAPNYDGLVQFSADGGDASQTSSLLIDRCFLAGVGPLLRCSGGAGKVFVKESVLAASGVAVSVQSPSEVVPAPLTVDVSSSTLSATSEIFRVTGDPAGQGVSRWYIDQCVFASPGPWKLDSSALPSVIRGEAKLLDPARVKWWGSHNGVMKDIRYFAAVEGPTPRFVETAAEWQEFWGEGHNQHVLTGDQNVVMMTPLPDRPDQLEPAAFRLHPSSQAASWGNGKTIGADVAGLAGIGPVPMAAASGTPGTSSKKTPAQGGGNNKSAPKRPGF